jgi:cytidylate kinase
MVVVTISGPSGSGKSTIAKALADRLGVSYYSIGNYFREKAREAGMDVKEFTAQVDEEFHHQADKHVDELSRKGDVVLEGRLVSRMASHADYRVYLTAPMEVLAKRIANREGMDLAKAKARIEKREGDHQRIFSEIYDIDISDLSGYDLVLNTEHYGVDGVLELVERAVRLALEI